MEEIKKREEGRKGELQDPFIRVPDPAARNLSFTSKVVERVPVALVSVTLTRIQTIAASPQNSVPRASSGHSPANKRVVGGLAAPGTGLGLQKAWGAALDGAPGAT